MSYYYTSERNIQIVISLLKAHGIKRIITSPGATDVAINISLQHDPYFKLYSCVDERSAAYMACGMAEECGEPVAITCTGATSSRNYLPGLTEAYYRNLPILAITCSRSNALIGHLVNQVTDRSDAPRDTVKISIHAQRIHCKEDEWDVTVKVNKAILELRRNGGGPCHINLESSATDFDVKELPNTRVIKRYFETANLPQLKAKRVAVFVGAHSRWSDTLTNAVDKFCETHNAVVLHDCTSNYKGKYGIAISLINDQLDYMKVNSEFDLMIHIGSISNIVYNKAQAVWRVAEDGELRDTFKKLEAIFQMKEESFFEAYSGEKCKSMSVYEEFKNRYMRYLNLIPELPFSNVWTAQQLCNKLPQGCILHLGIRNSLRSWSYFDIHNSIYSYSNTGGFGIDGGISSLIGASMVNKNKLYFGIFGDLLFFYDMNSIGNRDISSNIRIMIINNGLGQEFKNYSCSAAKFGEETDLFIAAKGHFGNQSRTLIQQYAQSLGFNYLKAENKEEFLAIIDYFVNPEIGEKPIILEVFTNTEEESKAHELVTTLSQTSKMMKKAKTYLQTTNIPIIKDVVRKFI